MGNPVAYTPLLDSYIKAFRGIEADGHEGPVAILVSREVAKQLWREGNSKNWLFETSLSFEQADEMQLDGMVIRWPRG